MSHNQHVAEFHRAIGASEAFLEQFVSRIEAAASAALLARNTSSPPASDLWHSIRASMLKAAAGSETMLGGLRALIKEIHI